MNLGEIKMGWFKNQKGNKIFSSPERITKNSFRYYKTSKGIYPSVTSILAETKSIKSKQKLKNWQKYNKKEKERVLKRGRDLDNFIQSWFDGKYIPPNSIQEQVVDFLIKLDPLAIEYPISSSRGYAGCFDMLAKFKNEKILIDWKTSSRKKTKKDIEDYFLQIVAYRYALIENLGIYPDKCLIVVATEGYKKPTYFELKSQKEIKFYQNKFFNRLNEYQKKYEKI